MSKPKRRTRPLPPTLSRLPPLNSLRAFVVAARHLSFTRAAEDLHVSAAAIGQQIRILEDYVGQRLFERDRRQLQLTAAGRALAPGLAEAFESVMESVARLAADEGETVVRISATPSFAGRWLAPRLESLHQALPGIEVEVHASTVLVDVERDETDCVIRYGKGGYAGLFMERLFPEMVVPVCSAEFAESYGLDWRTRSLQGVPLLHEVGPEHNSSGPDWGDWLRAEGFPVRFSDSGYRLNLSSLVLDAAAAGQGLGLGKLRLAEADLISGRLVAPLGRVRPVESAYYFATAPHKAKLPQVALFLEWLRAETRLLREIEGFLPLPDAATARAAE